MGTFMISSFVFLGIVLFIAWFFKQPAVKGKCGELLVSLCLKIGLDKKIYRILNNVMIPDSNGGTTQIDHVVLSPFGLFIIETKNMKGWIFGDANSAKWMQQIFRSKHQFQNPFRQNYKHIMCLAEQTNLSKDSFTHIIVFVGDCEIKTRDKLPPSLVTGGRSLLRFIKTFSKEMFSKKELDEIEKNILSNRLKNSSINQKAHVKYVKEEVMVETELPICPKCGATMIKREAKRGTNVGNTFWGCPNYPQCRGIIKE